LDLLERACNGEKGLGDKVQQGRESYMINQKSIPWIHGYISSLGGLDAWVFNEFQFTVQQKEDKGLFLDVRSGEFYSDKDLILSKRISDLEEGIAFFENNLVDDSVIRNLQKGILIKRGLATYADLKLNRTDILESAKGIVSEEFLGKYQFALKTLAPFEIPEKYQKNLFFSMFINNFNPQEVKPFLKMKLE